MLSEYLEEGKEMYERTERNGHWRLEGNKENTGLKNQGLPTLAGWIWIEIEVAQSKLTNRVRKSQKSRK
jgi:hypothetical protein